MFNRLTREANVSSTAGTHRRVVTATREITDRVRLRAAAVCVRAGHRLATICSKGDGLGEALDVGDIVGLRGVKVASVKVELGKRAALALGATLGVRSKDAANPLRAVLMTEVLV
jgi:hypothetical protein